MSWQKGELLYEGKAKKIFEVAGHGDHVWIEYKDSLTAFNGEKKAEMKNKGVINRQIASLIFSYLKNHGVPSHHIDDVGDDGMIAQKVEVIPLEVVVRNTLAGSTAKKFGIEEGTPLESALVEFFYKRDDLGDPFISDEQALMLKIAEQAELQDLKFKALQINQLLLSLFAKAGIQLVDFKLEFGRCPKGEMILADEISPDSCRLWDEKTGEKMDKDRFRRDLGDVIGSYEEVYKRLEGAIK